MYPAMTDHARAQPSDGRPPDDDVVGGPLPSMEAVHEELRLIAAAYMRRERGDHTLQPTALVNEAADPG